MKLTFIILEDLFAICRMESDSTIPDWALKGNFASITKTCDELSIVCPQKYISEEVKNDKGWKVLKVEGPLDFSLTGVLVKIAAPLADKGISIFALSTYDTDYIMVKEADLKKSISVLTSEGHKFA